MKLYLIFFLFATWTCVAQRVEFADAMTGISVENIEVFIPKSNIILRSGNGIVSISKYPKANQFVVSADGYKEIIFNRKALKILSNTIFLEPKTSDLDEVIVSHSKWKEKRINIPKKTTSQKASAIFTNQPQTAADVLEKGNGVFIQKSQLGGGSPIIRGLSTNRILLTIDGVRMNNAIFRSGNVQNIISIDPFVIAKSEVIHGPGSVVYGSDAIGGVINFNTLETENKIARKAGLIVQRFSSANTESTSHFKYHLQRDKWNTVTSFSYSRFGNLIQGKNGPNDFLRNSFVRRIDGIDHIIENKKPREQVNTQYQQYNLFNKISFKANKNHSLKFTSIYSETSNYDRYDRLQELDKANLFKFSEWFYGPQKWLFLNLNSNYKLNHRLFDEIKTSVAFQRFEESRNQRRFNNNFRINNTENVNAYSLNVDAIKKINKLSFTYGIELIHNIIGSKANRFNINTKKHFKDVSLRYPDGSSWNSLAIYNSLSFPLGAKNKISVGLRYNFVNIDAKFQDPVFEFPFDKVNINNSAINGNLGWIHKISKKWNTNIFLSTAFRAPNIDDVGKIFQSSEPGTLVVPNPNLRPETAYNIESNIVFHTSKINITFSPYFTFLDNALSRNTFKFNGNDSLIFQGIESEVTAVQNSNSQRIYGFDVNGRVQLTKSLSALFNYHLIEGEEKLSNGKNVPIRHVTPNFGKLALLYRKNRFEISSNITFSQSLENSDLNPRVRSKTAIFSLDENGFTYSPSWYTLNLQSQIILTKDLKVSLNFENLTNQRYRTYSSGISAAGLNVISALQLRF